MLQRLEDARAGEIRKGHAAHARDDDRREVEAGVAVRPARPRRKVQRVLTADDLEHVRVRVHRVVRGQPAMPATLPQSRSPLVWLSMWRISERRSVVRQFGNVFLAPDRRATACPRAPATARRPP